MDVFWYDDLNVLFDRDSMIEFFPTKNQTLNRKLNALMRMSIYISILLSVYHKDYKYLSLALGVGLLTVYIYKRAAIKPQQDSPPEFVETFEDAEKCTKPTLDNPFMNPTMKDYMNIVDNKIVDRPPACDIKNDTIKKEIESMFEHNLYRDVDDVFGKFNSQRQFYTMPSTTIPNKQDEFAKWLYLSKATCKENNDNCLKFEDVRAKSNQSLVYDPNQNPVTSRALQAQ